MKKLTKFVESNFIPEGDKLKHDFVGSCLSTATILILLFFTIWLPLWILLLQIIPVIVIAFWKEYDDETNKTGTPEWMDIFFTLRQPLIYELLILTLILIHYGAFN